MNGDSKPSFSKTWWILFCISILAIALITVSLIDSKDLPITIIGAVLGVVMTVFASFILLKGQSEQQADLVDKQSKLQTELQLKLLKGQSEQQAELADKQSKLQTELQLKLTETQNKIEREGEKETEIFKQKLKNYQEFLNALNEYLSTKERSAKIKLKFQTAALAMHADYYNLADINLIVKTIIDGNNGEDMDDEHLIPELFNLSKIFRNELYGNPANDKIPGYESFENSIASLAQTIENSDVEADSSEIEAEDAQEAADDKEESAENWKEYVQGLKGWKVTYKKGNIVLSNEKTPALIEFKLKSGYYVVASSYGDDKEYPKYLQKDIKTSSRSGANWWRSLNTLRNYRVKSGELVENLSSNDAARALVIRWIDRLIPLADEYTPKND